MSKKVAGECSCVEWCLFLILFLMILNTVGSFLKLVNEPPKEVTFPSPICAFHNEVTREEGGLYRYRRICNE